MGIRNAWEKRLAQDGHKHDAAQARLIDRLERLQCELEQRGRQHRSLVDKLFGRPARPVRGLYIWGDVGRGKTLLMDLFFESLAIEKKRRIHFHRMMREIHTGLARLDDTTDPLDRVAAGIAARTRVLCFDEFFVDDIGDAMILARLLRGLFDRGVTLVATSNSKPDDLYREGLQRSRFLPAIDLLNDCTDVVHLDSDMDYRLRLLEKAGTYLSPDTPAARATLERLFADSASSQIARNIDLEVNGRPIHAVGNAKGIAWFEFQSICDGPRSQADYIELARWYPTVIVSGVPRLTSQLDNQARRFIALVDEFYDRRVKLIISAARPATELYTGSQLSFEFERTSSRLIEMQSSEYLAAPHLA